jgi:hypothetical protein
MKKIFSLQKLKDKYKGVDLTTTQIFRVIKNFYGTIQCIIVLYIIYSLYQVFYSLYYFIVYFWDLLHLL